MKISCPTCAAKYSVADEKIQSRLAKIRCRKCSSTIVIDGMTTPASVYIGEASAPNASGPPPQDAAAEGAGGRPSGASFASPVAVSNAPAGPSAPSPGAFSAPPAGFSAPAGGFSTPAAGGAPAAALASEPVGPAADEYAVDIADNDQRNMTIHQIVGAYNEGLITADTYIWKEGMADWQTLAEVKPVADAIQAAARPVAPAAVRRPETGSGPDLFGRIATAGSEDDIATSAPEPAVSAGTGARNESSVLFSLSALTGSGDTGASGTGRSKSGRGQSDDSGLIDLTALTASEGASASPGFGASAAYGASPLISAPLGGVSGPALGAGFAPGYGAPRSGGRTLVIAASVLAVAILGGAGLFFFNRSAGDAEPTTALEPAPAATPAATSGDRAPAEKRAAEPEPVAAPVVASKPEPTKPKEKETEPASVTDSVNPDELPAAAPEPAPKPSARPSAPKPKPAPPPPAPVRAKPTPPPAPEPEPVAPPPKPAPAVEKKPAGPRCDCKPADLMCAMRCSAKK